MARVGPQAADDVSARVPLSTISSRCIVNSGAIRRTRLRMMRRTVGWLLANPPGPVTWGLTRYLNHDAFDYESEDAAIAAARRARDGWERGSGQSHSV